VNHISLVSVFGSLPTALEIRKRTLPVTHLNLASSYNNIGLVHYNMGDYSKALQFCLLAVDIAQQTLPSNHPDFRWYKNNLLKRKII
jgi:tetratricopeptide (TPR) repeat protein